MMETDGTGRIVNEEVYYGHVHEGKTTLPCVLFEEETILDSVLTWTIA